MNILNRTKYLIILSTCMLMISCKKNDDDGSSSVGSSTDGSSSIKYKLDKIVYSEQVTVPGELSFSDQPDDIMDTVYLMSQADTNLLYKAYVYYGTKSDGEVTLKAYTDSACTVYDGGKVTVFSYDVAEVLTKMTDYYEEDGQIQRESIYVNELKQSTTHYKADGSWSRDDILYYDEDGNKDTARLTTASWSQYEEYEAPVENGTTKDVFFVYTGAATGYDNLVRIDTVTTVYENGIIIESSRRFYNTDGTETTHSMKPEKSIVKRFSYNEEEGMLTKRHYNSALTFLYEESRRYEVIEE